ncbi:hypothetical protein LTR54_017331 [Friedmanniomyces endolithicus]|nr:hypothetical protein LTR54_017331 [Friedmanniomyces endolithicus]
MSPLSRTQSLKSIRQATCGAAPLDKEQQARFKDLLAEDAQVTQVWGMTETTCITTMFRWPEDDVSGSVGMLVPHMEAKLVDDDGNNISAYDTRGEICIRGPCVIPGYFENGVANSASFLPGGWFKTGDVAFCDGRTLKWYIVDRKKELIKVRGFQVAPIELESVLLSHPGIDDAAVIGVHILREDGELPRAYIVRRPGIGDTLTAEDIRVYMSQKLANYKRLNGGVRFVESIPKNATGKILKRVLKEEAQAEIALRHRL